MLAPCAALTRLNGPVNRPVALAAANAAAIHRSRAALDPRSPNQFLGEVWVSERG